MPDLVRLPPVVVIAGGDDVVLGELETEVARSGQAGLACVENNADSAVVSAERLERVVRFFLVVHNDALDVPVVALVDHGRHRLAYQLGATPGRDDDTDPGRGGRLRCHGDLR